MIVISCMKKETFTLKSPSDWHVALVFFYHLTWLVCVFVSLCRQGYVNDKMPVEVLIEKYLRMEQRKLLIPIATSGNVVIPKKKIWIFPEPPHVLYVVSSLASSHFSYTAFVCNAVILNVKFCINLLIFVNIFNTDNYILFVMFMNRSVLSLSVRT